MGVAALSGCLAGVGAVLVSVYFVLLYRGLRNELVIGDAIAAMRAALHSDPAPQRVLLGVVADLLTAQDSAAATVEFEVRELTLCGDGLPDPADLVKDLLSLPEPQMLIVDFLRAHAGGPASEAMFAAIAADMIRQATGAVFGDRGDQELAELDRLMLLADQGQIGAVALASFDWPPVPGSPQRRVPRVADMDVAGMTSIARSLDRTTRRQLRLATVLHGQAEAMMRIRRSKRRGVAALWMRMRNIASFPLPRKPEFRQEDLEALAVAFDAVGEILQMADEHLADGEPSRAAHLMAGLHVPVPAGFPARMFLQESLAQARPLARFGVWHRLAVCRWAASSGEVTCGELFRTAASGVASDLSLDEAARAAISLSLYRPHVGHGAWLAGRQARHTAGI
jgi:hypothetical protein